ncbi:hypothetical protein A374_17824 [Fictibacillus macauensis ZFHKF-1]|uniref:DUF2922 domain-containing protein n=1 Tax=Fictibacillus macauensis ZFHKF-1 TaxID=1196324 RepID=I8UAT8_9BACL|nr:DUF2922 domain-containing protein [Fictibacillus macauensis]EIT83918.1 hypothetical protein A374_17824 [Fictibacillus macauensis ZFHKF-1]
MAKTLELQFINEQEKVVTLSIDSPKEPVNGAAVKAAMETIIAQNVFNSKGGNYVKAKGARLVERNASDVAFS